MGNAATADQQHADAAVDQDTSIAPPAAVDQDTSIAPPSAVDQVWPSAGTGGIDCNDEPDHSAIDIGFRAEAFGPCSKK